MQQTVWTAIYAYPTPDALLYSGREEYWNSTWPYEYGSLKGGGRLDSVLANRKSRPIPCHPTAYNSITGRYCCEMVPREVRVASDNPLL